MTERNSIDQAAMVAIVVSILAITLSAGIVGYTVHALEKVDHLEASYDLLSVRYANQTAWLKAHGIEVPE